MVKTILIATSGIGERLGDLTKNTNKSLIKVGDKYAICHIIELYNQYNAEFIITLGYCGKYVRDFILLAYPEKKITFVQVDLFVGNGSSLGYSLLKAKHYLQKPFIFHCCDSIVLENINFEENKNVLYCSNCENSTNYSNVKCNNNVVLNLNYKNNANYDYIYTGIASIYDFKLFWEILQNEYENNKYDASLSDVNSIRIMVKTVCFECVILSKWYDTGNIESYNIIKTKIPTKYTIIEKSNESICFLEDRVIKFIDDVEINKKRVIRGKSLFPLSPIIFGYNDNFISMELINGVVASCVYEDKLIYNLLNWCKTNLWINNIKDTKFIRCCYNFYIVKTLNRLSKLNWLDNKEKNVINGVKCTNVIDFIKKIPIGSISNDTFVQFHGDFILENIIKTNNSYKLIDWRHEFDDQLHHGDIYYELAKLRHNIIFNHENIANGLFRIEHINDEVIVDLKCNYFLINQLNDFEKFISEHSYDMDKIKLITAIIWLNMAPLYNGKLSEFLFYFGKYNLFLLA